MQIIQSFLTNNDCYKSGKSLAVKGLMLHSVGCAQPSAEVFVKSWNVPQPQGRQVCVHAFVEPGKVYQTLPWNMRGWHGGGDANNTHIGVEMTEPVKTDKEHIKATYETTVELFAFLCKQFNLDPLADGVIISHYEGWKRRIASNSGDPEHTWKDYELTMDMFRNGVQQAVAGNGEVIFNNTKKIAVTNGDVFTDDIKQAMAGSVDVVSDIVKPDMTASAEGVSDWARKTQEWVMRTKISDGKRPKEPMTREEAWTMFFRYEEYRKNLPIK